jgi:hypothetical protein
MRGVAAHGTTLPSPNERKTRRNFAQNILLTTRRTFAPSHLLDIGEPNRSSSFNASKYANRAPFS